MARKRGVGVWDRKNGLKENPRDFRARTQREEGLFSSFKRSSGRDRNNRSFQEQSVPQIRSWGIKEPWCITFREALPPRG